MRTKSVLKRQRQQTKANERNKHYKSMMKSAIRSVLECDNHKSADQLYRNAVSTIDSLVSKGVIHKNTAARRKSKITRHLNSLA